MPGIESGLLHLELLEFPWPCLPQTSVRGVRGTPTPQPSTQGSETTEAETGRSQMGSALVLEWMTHLSSHLSAPQPLEPDPLCCFLSAPCTAPGPSSVHPCSVKGWGCKGSPRTETDPSGKGAGIWPCGLSSGAPCPALPARVFYCFFSTCAHSYPRGWLIKRDCAAELCGLCPVLGTQSRPLTGRR